MIELHIRSIEDIEPPHDNTALEISPDMWPYGDSDQHGDPLREHLHTHERFTLDQIRRDVLEAQCTWPAPFLDTSWTDTEKGELTFGSTTMTGWTFVVDGQVRNEWKCVKSDTFDEDGYLLMVTTESFVQFVTAHYYAYLCLRTKKVTDVSYRYYIEEPIQSNVDSERILVFPQDNLDAIKSVCYPKFGASGSEYKLLVKTGSEMSAAITCPYNFLGVYDYTHTSFDGTQTCSAGNSLWDMCSENSRMSFNLGQCPTKVAYSGSPSVSCVDTVPLDGNNYVTVYNIQDASVDDSATYRFSCFAISADGSTSSVAPKYCRQGQTPDSVPVSNTGQPVGATMSIPNTYTTCPTCPEPTSPDGGSVYVQTDGAVTTAHYQCAEDYSLYGAETRTCLSDNTWELDMPACKCNEPTPPTNGEVTVSVDGVVASYNCLAGYTLTGNRERFCQDDGKAWNGSDPTCDICDTLADPAGGSVNITIDGPTSKASYRCDVGYTLVGVKERFCLNGGSWDSTEPSCVQCPSLSRPDLGSYNLTTDGFISTATFACTTGYLLSYTEPLVCQNDGAWDTTEPECVCETLSPPTDGDIAISSDGRTATYTCSAGFTLNGDTVRVCLMDGTAWNGTDPTCVKCPDLPELPSGDVTVSLSGPQTVAIFTCKRGYTLSGFTMSVCGTDGTWDNDMPTCVLCDSVADPSSGSVNVTTNGTVSKASYECSPGYYLDGETSSSCLVDGSWDSTDPKCYCDVPTAPPNGRVILSNDKLSLIYQCDTGYTISGSSDRVCSSDGTGWTANQPTCESCQTLPNVAGGSVELVSTGTITQGNFSCDVGYTMNGVSILTCRSDGSWDLSPPSCVLCDLPGTPVTGSYTQETDGKVTTTTYACADSYGLSGSSTSDCRSDGTWDSLTPTCVECPAMVDPPSGEVSVSSNGSHSLAVFSCVSGYHVLGVVELICGDAGTWSENPPTCVCDEPVTPLNGTVTSNGTLAVYTCDTGYAVSEGAERSCADNGTGWSGVQPLCVTCVSISSPQNGSVNLTTEGQTTVAMFSCSVGYSVNGSPTSTCQPDGSWDTPTPLCSQCNQLSDLDSGTFFLDTNGTVTSAALTCDSGYEIYGSPIITCDVDGLWSSTEPSCVCETPSTPTNGSVNLSEDRLTATYSCNAGFTLQGTSTRNCQPAGLSWSGSTPSCVKCSVDSTTPGIGSMFLSNGTVSSVQFSCAENYTMSGSATTNCQTDGQLDQPAPTCVSCVKLSSPSSGSVTISTNGTTSIATYSCAESYYSVGEVARTCGQDGLWDGSHVICICEPPLFPANGNVSVSSDGLTATYVCDTGYILAGKSERMCTDDGTGWSDTQPSCTTCDPITAPTRGSLNLTSDGSKTTAVSTCDVGTSLLGDQVLTCLGDGTWDFSAPTCVSCPDLSDPASGQVQTSTDGSKSTAEFSCSSGYYLSGIARLTCELTGLWSDNVPTCVCNPPSDLDNGQVVVIDSGYRAEYTCDLGLSLDGVSERRCGADGSGWSDSDPVCVPCLNLGSPAGGSMTTSTDGATTTAKFNCDSGYSMKGSPYLACLVTGTWNDSAPTCVSCPSLTPPASGSLTVTTAGTTTIATYSCQSGYKLVGTVERVCSDAGMWDSTDPTCVCIPPLTPANGELVRSADGRTVNYTCKSGYSLEGVATRQCQSDGSGWDEASPTCNSCAALDNINGGYVTMTTDGQQTKAIYSCDSGYSIGGVSVLTCRSDGTWDLLPPVCTSCEPQSVPISGDVTMVTDGQTTMATFTCSSGYTLQGQQNITCKGDGTWNFVTPSCVECTTLSPPDSGSYSLSTDGSVTMATFSCVSNYYIVGSDHLTCDTAGNWDSAVPVCVCVSPTPPSHGSVESDGLLANYSCDNGYSLSGASIRICDSNGVWWNGAAPTCNKCDTLGNVKNGDISLETDGITTISVFSCGSGYTISGRDKATCRENGTWDANKSECVECQSLSSPTSGTVSLQTNGTVTVAEFSCIAGYEVLGSFVLTCDGTGQWDTIQPTCVCKEPDIPVNGSVMYSENRLLVTFSCDVGFSLSGAMVQTCQPEGPSWTDTPPTCVECAALTQTNGLNLNHSTNGTLTEITFTCDTGFTLTGTQQTTCLTNGSWDSAAPSCVQCPSLATPSSGTLDVSTNGSVSTAVYTCANGYNLVGDTIRICQDTGQWTGQDVKCFCMIPETPVNGSLTVSADGETVTYTCDVEYNLIGDSVRHCGNDGTGWTGVNPNCATCKSLSTPPGGSMNLSTDGIVTTATFTCEVGSTIMGTVLLTCQSDSNWDQSEPSCVKCPALSDPDSGYVSVDSDGLVSKATFTCDSGYKIVGAEILNCQTNGSWSDSSPICVCEPPVKPVNGQNVLSGDGFTVKYSCENGYTLSGVNERQCGANGTGWSGSDPNCVSCPILGAPSNGNLTQTTDGVTTSIQFSCDTGFSLSGEATLACLDTGSWNGTSPTCVSCMSLAQPDSGSIELFSGGINTYTRYNCSPGYYLVGEGKRTCSENGSWTYEDPRCVCEAPGTPIDGKITVSDDGMTVQYGCEVGFTLRGTETQHCQSGGAGWDESSPSCTACEALQNLAGGSVTQTTHGTATEAIFICETGYTMTGSPVLACRSDGSWNMSQPTCTSCQPQQVPAGGNIEFSSDGSTTEAAFSCSKGYTLHGVANTICRSDGSWDYVTPTCVECPTLDSPASGAMTLNTDGTTSTAMFTCFVGYHLKGMETLTCDSSGVWTDFEPVCKCDILQAPVNGSVEFAPDGMTLNYSCSAGYTLVGAKTRTCGTDGSGWNGTASTCVRCEELSSIDNGELIVSTDGVVTMAVFTCYIGSTINGSSTAECGTDGSWTVTVPQCAVCPNISAPTNGSIDYQSSGAVTVAKLTCDTGFSMSGEDTLYCGSDGVWNAGEPICVECSELASLASGETVMSNNGTTTRASFTCDAGYYLDGLMELYCLSDGIWDNNLPTCVCDRPSPPSNGSVWLSADGMTAEYSCELGFTLNGQGNNTCGQDGAGWSSNPPTCVECQALGSTDNGRYEIKSDSVVTMATVTCDEGYSLNGSFEISCQTSGFWYIPVMPSCVKCQDLPAISSGTVSVSTNGVTSVRTYTCLSGYYLLGSSTRFCNDEGNWSDSEPVCVCNAPLFPQNGNVSVSDDYLTATAVCNTGYSLTGDRQRTCQQDGSGWNGIEPTCSICVTLSSPAGGTVNLQSDGTTSFAEYMCSLGYSMEGKDRLQCRSDGSWDILSPSCTLCQSLSNPDNGVILYETNGINTVATIECEAGHTLKGADVMTCLNDGRWNESLPSCVACPSISALDSGVVELLTDGLTSTAVFSCAGGYTLQGQTTLTCGLDGVWSDDVPKCFCIPPLPLANGTVVVSINKSIVTYSCEPGFTLDGNNVRVCQSDGSGWDGSVPTCVECEPVAVPDNGSLSVETDGVDSIAVFTCNLGFSLSGEPTAQCRADGRWNTSSPSCVKCDEATVPANGSVVIETDGILTTARYSCDVGYSVPDSHLQPVACQSDGSWESQAPICSKCADIPELFNEVVSLSSNGTMTVATFDCLPEYYLSGEPELSCQGDGTWNHEEPTCLCNSPPTLLNGNITSDGMTATYTCEQGYSMNGTQTRVCRQDGTGWNGEPPTCVKCESLPATTEAYTTSTSGVSTVTSFTCPVATSLKGNSTLTCGSDGIWDSSVPSCVTCEVLSNISSGNIVITTDTRATYATYGCVAGYYLIGPSVRTCQDTGLWDATQPTCVCDAPEPPMQGNLTLSGDKTSVTFSCEPGYSINGQGSLSCLEDGGGWSGEVPTCSVCDTLPTPVGGSVEVTFEDTVSVAKYTCQNGFTISGQSVLSCRSDGTWNVSAPICASCPNIDSPAQGNVELLSDGMVTTAFFTCDLGFTVDGSAEAVCRSDGTWDNPVPVCVECPVITAPSSGTLVQWSNGIHTVANISCATGYYLEGNTQLVCDSSQTWDSELPNCYCEEPAASDNGWFELTTDRVTAHFLCLTGYTLRGAEILTCQSNGSGWDLVPPVCETCESLSYVENGTAVLSSNGTTTVSTFTCQLGASLNGSGIAECGNDGKWNVSSPACVYCSALASIQNGTTTLTTDGVSTSSSFTCDLGFTLKGPETITCDSSGLWGEQPPTCVPCSSLTAPYSGSYEQFSNGSFTYATFTCTFGYDLVGSEDLSCRADGAWDHDTPKCVCSAPYQIDNGNYTMSSDGMSVVYVCQTSYTLVGDDTMHCGTDGSGWQGTTPKCVACQSYPEIDTGSFSEKTNGTVSSLVYSCPQGYSMSGSQELKCGIDGSWDVAAPVCVSCTSLKSLGSGNYTAMSDGVLTTVQYSCSTGYDLIGNSTSTCLTDGSWDFPPPICYCQDPEAPLYGKVSSNGTTAVYTCDSGYSLNGVSRRTCSEDGGGWSDAPPTCETCETLPIPTGGRVTFSTDGQSTVATIDCDIGYTLDGVKTLQCTSDGTWKTQTPTCGVPCSTLSTPANATIVLESDGSTTKAVFECDFGSTLKGERTVSCRADGTWDFTEPTCVSCPQLLAPSSGEISVTTDGIRTTAEFSCTDGYHLVGLSVLECLDDGVWNSSTPVCECNLPAVPQSGGYNISADSSEVVFYCDSGFTLKGSSQITCMTDGSGYNASMPECVQCEELQTLSGGSQKIETNGVTSSVTMSCDTGYSLNGEPQVICSDNGTWEISEAPECVLCAALTSVQNGSMRISTDGRVSSTSFQCDTGYSIKGVTTAVCQTDGTWNSEAPTCVSCPELSSPDSGYVVMSANGTITTASFSCMFGYHLSGSTMLQCLEDGKWDAEQPVCVCDILYQPSNGKLSVSENGYRVTYSCHLGYTLSGNMTRQCLTNGTGWDGQDPVCVTCPSVIRITNGNFVTSSNGIITSTSYSCFNGYSMKGEQTLECGLDGTWSSGAPDCVLCPAIQPPESGTMNQTTDGRNTTVIYTCAEGYVLKGTSIRTCLDDGLWTDSDPICECVTPAAPVNGDVISDGQMAVYSCTEGFTMQGTSTRNCGKEGAGWNSTAPTCTPCGTLDTSSNAIPSFTTDGVVTSVTYGCDVGYTLTGTTTSTCRSDGSWSFTAPMCVACETLSPLDNGVINITTDGTTTQATYTCESGFSLKGFILLTCRSDGAWDFSPPVCVACGPVHIPPSSNVTLSSDGTSTFATYTCASYYYMSGPETITCLPSGEWESNTTQCLCIPPAKPDFGNLQLSIDGSRVMYTCDTGFSINGSIERQCLENSLGWDGSDPLCITCDVLDDIFSGNLTLITNETHTAVAVQCDVGSSVNGSVSVTCGQDGSWMESIPKCVTCPALSSPTNGELGMSTNGTTTFAYYTCSLNYTLRGQQNIACGSDGQWETESPQCVRCTTENLTIDSGSYHLSTNGSMTQSEFSCTENYHIYGNPKLYCTTNGTWDSDVPKCVCDHPGLPENGDTQISTDKMETRYSCHKGYSLVGMESRVCQGAGLGWALGAPVCVACLSVVVPENGSVVEDTNGTVTMATFSCDVGFSLKGQNILSCLQNGSWDLPVPDCTQCAELGTPHSGNMSLSSDGQQTTASYQCAVGYHLDGVSERVCADSGNWDSIAPICKCDTPGTPEHGIVTVSENSSIVSYTCEVGYSLSGTAERTCQTDGTGWSKTQPLCVLCGTLTTLSGGNIQLTSDGHMSVAKFTCHSGYSMDGQDTIGCREDGTWNSTGPSCSECSTLATPTGSAVSISTDGVSTIAVYSCAEGYSLAGSSHVTCKSTGNWDLSPPSCVRCPDLDPPSSGELTLLTDGLTSTAVFQCEPDYHIFGSQNVACQLDGTWSALEPECRCDLPPIPDYAYRNISQNGSNIRYSCETGYSLNGPTEQVCLTDGSGWDAQAPSCSKCEDLVGPSNGSFVLTTNGLVTIATVLCDVGGSFKGTRELTCSDTGIWDFPAPSCVVCPELASLDNGTVTLSTNGSVTVAELTCDSGSSISGSHQLTCKTDGLWDGMEQVCADCPPLTQPLNGDLVISSNGTHSTAEFSCNTGYEILGEQVLLCLSNGSWDAVEPLCGCKVPSTISNGEITVSSDRTIATYSCHNGFTLNTNPQRLCLEDGSGWAGDEPICTKCDELTNPVGGNVEMITDGQQTFANITCPSGYTVSGNSELTCRSDGTWDVAVPSCSICDTVDKPDHGQVIFDSDRKTTRATLHCEVGYSLSGSSEMECRADGSWDFNIPTCVKCPDLVSPENGNMSLSSNAVLTTALFSCISGYEVFGQSSVICDDTGSWDAPEPFCVCEPPMSPVNGGFNLSSDHMTLTYNCENGFTLKGNTARYCAADGLGWDGSDPECVRCKDLTDPEGSVSDMTTNGDVSYKTFTCSSGSTLNGSSVVTCSEDGSWSRAVPNCAVCPSVSPPSGGSVAISTDGLTSIASFTCFTGYRLVGDSNLTCQSSGVWSSPSTKCVCNEPQEPLNGVTQLSADLMSVTYQCDDSYTLKGNQTRACDETGGGWDGLVPTCVQCESLDLAAGLSRHFTSDGVFSIAEFTCDTGFTLLGTPTLKCDENGAWSSETLPECVSCPEPVAPESGTVVMVTNGTSTNAYYACSTGYHVVGNSEIVCTQEGIWSASAPVCHCDLPINITNGYVLSDGSTATYFCLNGFSLNGEQYRNCQSDGSGWDGVSPTCVSCLTVNPPVNGTIIASTNGTVTKSSFGCDVGFTLKGTDVISCQSDGMLEKSTPVCVSCPELDPVSSGAVSLQTNGQTTVAMVTCTDGYEVFGSSVLTCLDDGQWNSQTPSCVCKAPDVQNSELVLSEDHLNVKYSCDVGFSLKGSSERSCLQDGGGWDLTKPDCVQCDDLTYQTGNVTFSTDGLESMAVFTCGPGLSLKGSYSLSCNTSGSWVGVMPECVSCPALNPPPSGRVEITSNGTISVADYSCSPGYILIGVGQRTCNTDRTWTTAEPTCICEAPSLIANGNYELSNNNTIAAYTCDAGYSLLGSMVRVCQEDGTGWNTKAPTCVKCPTYQSFSNGNINMTVVGGRTEAMFTCDSGCSLNGQSTLTCQSDGTWDFQTPNCACCPPISTVSSDNVTATSDGTTTTALFACANGYSLIGEDLLTCRSDGLWDFEQPHCSCIPPSDPWSGKVIVSSDGTVANYSCAFGYSLSGLSERKCLPDGSGWEGEEPSCLKCTDIPSPDNGTSVMSTDGLKTYAKITCVHGYSLTGESQLTCEADGNWSQATPSCVKCPSLTATSGLRYNSSSDGVETTASFQCIAGFELVGQTFLTCLRNGSWDAEQPTCLETTVTTTPTPCETCSECSTGATVGLAIVLSLTIVGLIIALAIIGRLYRKLRRSGAAKSLMYTAEGKTSGDPFTKHPGLDSDLTKLSLNTFDDIEMFSKATAPVSHRRHVLDLGRTQSSLAPSGHQKHLLELAGQTSSPAPLSYLTPSRSSTLAQFAVQNRRVSRLSDATSSSPSPKPYEASLLTPTPRTGLRGRSRTPSPAPSTEGQEYDTNLPQQILTPREVPMGDRASPKPTPTYDKMTAFQDRKKPGSSPKAAKRKKQPKKVVQESSSVPPRGSQSSPFKMKLTGVQHKDAKA